jgi:tRNA (guanine-N7-)-methyltransferase
VAGTLYGRRKGKSLRTNQARLLDELLPKLALPAEGLLDPGALFAAPMRELHLEIGFGGGEHLAREAAAHPDIGFIGCEPFINGVAKLLAQIDAQSLTNVRIHAGDARDILKRLSVASLDRVDLLYPDPWPKRRQRKRRFVSDETLAMLARCLRLGGTLRFASDIDDYTGWTLAHVLRNPDFHWYARPADWQAWPSWEPTRYERKAREEGREGVYLTFRRC